MEAVWVEIKNKNSKNIICGCIYRHPRSLKIDFDHFNKYIDSTLDKLNKEKKKKSISVVILILICLNFMKLIVTWSFTHS